MLAQKNRLSKEGDIARVRKNGRPAYNSTFKIKYLRSKDQTDKPINRFAVVISAKVSKKAVDRNRLRRQCAEIVRLNEAKIKPGFDVLIWVNKKTLELDYQALEIDLMAVLSKARLLV